MNVHGVTKHFAWLTDPHKLHIQGGYKLSKYYCNHSREVYEVNSDKPKGLCEGCGQMCLR